MSFLENVLKLENLGRKFYIGLEKASEMVICGHCYSAYFQQWGDGGC